MSFNKYRLKGAYHYEWYKTEPWYKEMVDEVVSFCKGRTLDVGCGDGLLAHKIAKEGYPVVGIDKDYEGLKWASQLGHPALFDHHDIETDGHFDGTFEYMACMNVIEHLKKPEVLKKIIKENITKGAIITTLEWQGGSFGEDHQREYTLNELMDFFFEFYPEPFRFSDPQWIGVKIKL